MYKEVSMRSKEEQKFCIALVRFLLILNFEPFELQTFFPLKTSSIRLVAHYDKAAQDIWTQRVKWNHFLNFMCQRLALSPEPFVSQQKPSAEPSVIRLMEEWNHAIRTESLRDKSIILLSLLHRRGRCPTRIYARLYADCEVLMVRILRQALIA